MRLGIIASTFFLPAVCLAQQPEVQISHPKAFALNYGVNDVVFWGLQPRVTKNGKIVTSPSHFAGKIIRYAEGDSEFNFPDFYFAISPGIAGMDGVRLNTNTLAQPGGAPSGDVVAALPDAGQGNTSAVRYFNGVWQRHCQTFLAVADVDRDQDAGTQTTTIYLYDFSGPLMNIGFIGTDPMFYLLTSYLSTGQFVDPELLLAQKFSLPLPPRFQADFTPQYTKQLGLPLASPANTYFKPEDSANGC
ncbi:MAG TPA: hypothetical protein VMH92_07370 [Acidocella sp.]|nr:hypothetical protein [Acidocella sp.]